MKIQYASDLHLEFSENWSYLKQHPLKVTGDVLVLAGDVGYLGDDNYIKHPFWSWASENYRQVICGMGNHEFYKGYDIAAIDDGFCLEIRSNVHSYYNAVVEIDDIEFMISTLWARIPLNEAYYTEQVISDFRRILYKGETFSFVEFNSEHKRCLNFLKQSVRNSKRDHKIVITHHVPSPLLQNPKFANSHANGAFIANMEEFIKESDIDFWIYGHSHYNKDAVIGKTVCLSNQLGYVFGKEQSSFDSGKYIII